MGNAEECRFGASCGWWLCAKGRCGTTAKGVVDEKAAGWGWWWDSPRQQQSRDQLLSGSPVLRGRRQLECLQLGEVLMPRVRAKRALRDHPATSSHYPEPVWRLREGRKSPSSSVRTWQSCALKPGQSSLLLHFSMSAGFSFSPLFSGIWPFLFGIYCSGSISADELVSVIDFASESHWPWALPQEFWPVALCAPLVICLDLWHAVLLVWLLLPGDPPEAMPS